jgi:hypothetical protein
VGVAEAEAEADALAGALVLGVAVLAGTADALVVVLPGR